MHAYMREPPSSRHGVTRHCVSVVLSAFTLVALAACGGGGGGGGGQQQQNNTAPTVTAGPDQTITLPTNSVSLTGSATDAQGQTLTYAWTASPAGVTFASASSAATTATFPGAGTYTLTLTVSDGSLTGTDALDVVVQAGANTAPTVSAGADQTITLPTTAVTLTGSATDAENNTLTYAWTSEPAGVTFADAAAAATTATLPATPGTYTLTLTANDGTTTGSDSLVVTLNPAGGGGTVFWPAPDTDDNLPDRGWARVTPAEAGMDDALLAQAEDYVEPAGGAGMVVKGGRLVRSWAFGTDSNGQPVNIDTKFAAQSTTKSIGSVVFGLAMADHNLALSDTAVSRLPSIGNPPGTDTAQRLNAITIQHLATHTAGFPKDGAYHALVADPGAEWRYSDGGLNWLADVLTNVFQADLNTIVTQRVWAPLGLNNGSATNTDDIAWRNNAKRSSPPVNAPSVPHRELASGMSINANAMARVGLLFLRNGNWESGRVLPENFITTAKTPVQANASLPIVDAANYPNAAANYGVLWWTNDKCALPNVPRDAYWGWGQYDSLVVVIPSLDIVVSRIGPSHPAVAGSRVFGEADWNSDYSVLAGFLNPIVASTNPTAPPTCTP